jgi:transcriptional regulator with XRE-family HTH domain
MHVQMRAHQDAEEQRMSAAPDQRGPTVRKVVLGNRLRQLREQSRLTCEQAAAVINGSGSKISRLELGKLTFKAADVAALLTCYGVAGAEHDELLQMARYANAPGWWDHYSGVLPDWFRNYVGFETAASQVRTYETQFIPGLLQTEDYMRAVTRTGRTPRTAEQIQLRVDSRRQRQNILARSNTAIWAIIDEGALRRPIGGQKVMYRQLEHLLRVIDRRNTVSIQVLPFAVGRHAGEAGAFSYLRFEGTGVPDIVYLEQLTRAFFVYPHEEVEQYREVFEQLSVAAQTPTDSAVSIEKIMADL